MILHKAGEYAIQISLHLAMEGEGRYVPIRDLADRGRAPYHFLGKICQRMCQGGILRSSKGPRGGVALARPPREITLLQVLEAIDGLAGFDRCVLGLEPCSNERPCPVHPRWASIKEDIRAMLSEKRLRDLAAEVADGRSTLEVEVGSG